MADLTTVKYKNYQGYKPRSLSRKQYYEDIKFHVPPHPEYNYRYPSPTNKNYYVPQPVEYNYQYSSSTNKNYYVPQILDYDYHQQQSKIDIKSLPQKTFYPSDNTQPKVVHEKQNKEVDDFKTMKNTCIALCDVHRKARTIFDKTLSPYTQDIIHDKKLTLENSGAGFIMVTFSNYLKLVLDIRTTPEEERIKNKICDKHVISRLSFAPEMFINDQFSVVEIILDYIKRFQL